MVESNLQTYEMDFSGLDAKRARVYTHNNTYYYITVKINST